MEEIMSGEAADAPAFDYFAWPLCAHFRDLKTCFLAPRFHPSILFNAFSTFLDLADDEILLAVLCLRSRRGGLVPGCALTTKRVYWLGDPQRGPEPQVDRDRPAGKSGPPPPRCEFLAYKDLPETINLTGVVAKVANLGEGREIALGTEIRALQALIPFLTEARARLRGENALEPLAPVLVEQLRRAWPSVVAADAQARTIQADVRRFHSRTTVAARAVVTPVLVGACVLVYLAMVARGVSPTDPDANALLKWGASFGPSVAIDGEHWRLLSCIFLHFGIIHLGLNMWCLLDVGPLVERFFGHLGFAAIYLLSGLGGALMSLVVHPLGVSAGASGAIFGIIGALLGFLVVRSGDVPLAILRPMQKSTLAFVGYNVVFGLIIPKVDMAAHLGGLAAGFIAGLLLAVGKADAWLGTLRRLAVVTVLSGSLWLVGERAVVYTRGRVMDDPQIAAGHAWRSFVEAGRPSLKEFDHIDEEMKRMLDERKSGARTAIENERVLDGLISQSQSLESRFAALPTENNQIRTMASKLITARKYQERVLMLMKPYLRGDGAAVVSGPDGLQANLNAENKALDEYVALRDAYLGVSKPDSPAP
jgi:rhomboid protease GluP